MISNNSIFCVFRTSSALKLMIGAGWLFLFLILNHASFAAAVLSNGTGGGTFSVTTTWTGSVVPTSADTAVIVGSDVVTLSGATTLAGLRIMPAAIFDNDNNLLILANTTFGTTTRYIVYGEHRISGDMQYTQTGGAEFKMIGPATGAGGLISGLGQLKISPCPTDTIFGNFTIPDADVVNGFSSTGCSGGTIVNNGTLELTNGNLLVSESCTFKNYGTVNTANGDLIISNTGKVLNYGTWYLGIGNITINGILFENESSGTTLLASGDISINGGCIVRNYGTITVGRSIIKLGSSTATWQNVDNSVLNIAGDLASSSTSFLFDAKYPGNTVNYMGSGNQTIKKSNTSAFLFPSTYWHLTCSNRGLKVFSNLGTKPNAIIKGNLTIRDSAQLGIPSSSYPINIEGNWYDSSAHADPFVEQLGTVTFSGDSAQMIVADSLKKETFYNLVLNDTGTVNNDLNVLTLNDSVTVLNTFTLTEGVLNLNKNVLTFANKADTALTGGSDTAYILSEDLAGLNQSRVQWNIQDSAGYYTIPFGVSKADSSYFIPFEFYIAGSEGGIGSSPGAGNISVSTYATPTSNVPYPASPNLVTQVYHPSNAVDRFWQVDVNGYTTNPTMALTFNYADPEKPSDDSLVAQRWNSNSLLWDSPSDSQSWSGSSLTNQAGFVTAKSVNTFSPWTLAKKTNYLKCPEIVHTPDQTICYGGPVQVLSTLTIPADFYTQIWSPSTGLDATTGNSVQASLDPGTITYTISGTDGAGCYDVQTISMQVNPLPTVTGSSGVELCNGNTATLTAAGASAYNWSPATYLDSPTNNPVVFSQAPVGTQSYSVTGYNEFGCANTHTLSVIVNALPTVNAGTEQFICLDDSASLSATGPGGNYTWSPASYYTTNTGATVKAGFPLTASSYTLTVTLLDSNACSASDAAVVTVVTALIANAGPDVTISCGSIAALTGSGGASYAWMPGTGLSATNSNVPVFDPTAAGMVPGTYTYSLVVASGIGCVSAPDEVVITVDSIRANAGLDVSICSGSVATFSGTGGNLFSWTPGTGLSDTAASNTIFSLSDPGTFVYVLTVSNGTGCTSRPDEISITVIAIPTVSAGPDITIRPDQGDTLHAAGNAQRYAWNPGICSDCLNPAVFPSDTTQYILIASNAFCSAADTAIAYYVPYPCDIFVPNAFSPNSDGENDRVKVYSHCLKTDNFAFRIYDRWGTLLFESFQQEESWQGIYQSMDKNTAVLVYQLQAETINNENIIKSGNISLVR